MKLLTHLLSQVPPTSSMEDTMTSFLVSDSTKSDWKQVIFTLKVKFSKKKAYIIHSTYVWGSSSFRQKPYSMTISSFITSWKIHSQKLYCIRIMLNKALGAVIKEGKYHCNNQTNKVPITSQLLRAKVMSNLIYLK